MSFCLKFCLNYQWPVQIIRFQNLVMRTQVECCYTVQQYSSCGESTPPAGCLIEIILFRLSQIICYLFISPSVCQGGVCWWGRFGGRDLSRYGPQSSAWSRLSRKSSETSAATGNHSCWWERGHPSHRFACYLHPVSLLALYLSVFTGSTDVVSCSVHGVRDPVSAALHIVLGRFHLF